MAFGHGMTATEAGPSDAANVRTAPNPFTGGNRLRGLTAF